MTDRTPIGLRLCGGLVLALFLMRFFYVAESAGQGDTLWIVGLWFVMFMTWTVVSWKSSSYLAPIGWFDLGVGMLAGGHIVSALVVVATTGDKRSAINLAWEWLGLATGWWLLRQQCHESSFRRELLIGLIATGTSVAGLGLYQHYVDFPRMAIKYGRMFDDLKRADAVEAASIRKELANENIPIAGPAVTLFEKRLRDSREPLGFFALANSLGGILATCLILAVSIAASLPRPHDRRTWIRLSVWMAVMILLGWCLLLTKSRTAWIGTAIGLALFSLRTQSARITVPRLRVAGGVLVVLTLMGWGLGRAGGLDRQVLTEAPKSLQYRLQYWSATFPMILDHALLGVGPGQFRWHYLFYKRPEASEEISDPHNLFLDVAANGGLVAFLGLLVICVGLAMKFGRSENLGSPNSSWTSSMTPSVVSGLATVAWLLLFFTGSDDRLLVLLPMAVAIYWGLRRFLGSSGDETRFLQIGAFSAAFGLLAHLCGAGGIGMPAIGLLLMALIGVADGGRLSSKMEYRRLSSGIAIVLVATSLGLMISLYLTGLRPVTLAQEKLLAGDRLLQRGRADAADVEYAAGAAADDWSCEPWRRRAELAYRKAETQKFRSNDSIQVAVELLRESKSRDPANFQDDRRLGEWWLARWGTTRDVKDAEAAVAAFGRARTRYPTNAALMAEMAFALDSAGSEAADGIARQALRQDDLNHERGHIDRFLGDPTRARLEMLLVRSDAARNR